LGVNAIVTHLPYHFSRRPKGSFNGELAISAERNRIGMDLHDGVIQSIYAVGLTLESARTVLAETPDETDALLGQAIGGLNDSIRDIRNFIMDLRPRRFDGDLEKGLARLMREFQANAMVLAQLEIPADLVARLPATAAQSIFLTTQEALANIARHAKASRVSISLTPSAGQVVLTVTDDGVGFEMAKQTLAVGHGLDNMRARAAGLSGTVEIESAPGHGATIRLSIPL